MNSRETKWENQTEPKPGTRFGVRARPGRGLAGRFSLPLGPTWNKQSDCPQNPMHLRLPDPHLHAHCFVFNTTWDKMERAWKAGQFRDINRDMPYFEAVFHSRLSYRLAELGLPIERTKTGW